MTKIYWIAIWIGIATGATHLLAADTATVAGNELYFVSPSLEVRMSPQAPGLDVLDIDGLGLGKRGPNAIRKETPTDSNFTVTVSAVGDGKEVEYRRVGQPANTPPSWSIEANGHGLVLVSQWSAADVPGPLVFTFNTGKCHMTVLGILNDDGTLRLPALMHLPGQGSLQIIAIGAKDAALDYTSKRFGDVTVAFPPATAMTPRIEYRLNVTAVYPEIPGIAGDHCFDSFRRNWLDALQLNPAHRQLSNNSRSTSCAFCYYEYGDIALHTPRLADGLTALDIMRQTLDAIFGGATAYGLPSPGNFPGPASDTLPSMIIAADDCVLGGNSDQWLAANYKKIKAWADEMLATDTNSDGLIKYGLSGNSGSWPEHGKYHPANWWDTIGFGYEDAYANALAYRALGCMEHMARQLGKTEDAARYHAAADKLKSAYFKTFYDPATGVLAGWRSADGQLHDYYFLWVNGIAIDYGLVPPDKANAIMDRLLAKIKEVGYTRFDFGLPGNLIPIPQKDYTTRVHRVGGSTNADGSDGFQIYENGGATACFSYFTLAAFYDLGRIQDGDRILFPILESFGKGGFEGRGSNNRTYDWKDWNGTGHGYEGFLSDNYYTVLAVLKREAALEREGRSASGAVFDMSVNHATRITTDYIDAMVSLDYPGFEGLSVDSLGKEHFPLVTIKPPAKLWKPAQAERSGSRVDYRRPGAASSESPRWSIEIKTNEIWLESHWSADDPPEPLVFNADNSVCHVTLLGLMGTNDSIRLPAIMHFPDQGSFRISADPQEVKSLGYTTGTNQPRVVQITFPGATQETPVVRYCLEAVAVHPKIAEIDIDARFDAVFRDWLNIFQIAPRWHSLANHATSDTCAFCYYEYGDIAEQTPPLADGVTALDMVRQTLDRIIGGGTAYGMPGYRNLTQFPEATSDTLPSLLIAAEDYVQGSKDEGWLATNYDQLKSWTDKMLATDRDGDGLIKYMVSGNSGSWPAKVKYRSSNWWDTIGFGHEDAYANALAFRALRGMEHLAQQSNHPKDQFRYRAAADKLKSAYFKTFFDPATGVLAGWRSADGRLHDYYFVWVNGIAIHYGLVPKEQANSIMDRLLAKMDEVGYTNFALGLPGNLIPVARKDYVHWYHNRRFGGGTNEDNSDGFQIYENGGATACFSYFTLAALYDLGRIQDGDRILFPLLESFAKGDFQGRGNNKMSKDWKAWDGTCWGYEGFLTDNYYALLAVMDREAAIKRGGKAVL